MEPGKVFTRDDLKRQFNFTTDEGTDKFLDMMESVESETFKVVHVLDERLLVFQDEYWNQFLAFMRSIGYSYDTKS